MIGTTRKITTSKTILLARVRGSEPSLRTRLAGMALAPAIAEAGIILDLGEIGIDIAEFLPDALYEGANIGAKSDLPAARCETLAVHEIVEFAIAHVLAGARHQIVDHLELGQRQFDLGAFPEGA